MNKNVNCSACDELKENASDFYNNGVTKTVCSSLKNDTGFNPKLTTLHTDCEDLDDANDCLVGLMEPELKMYELCDWKEFMKKFIGNIHQVIKAIICAICGIWENIHKLWCNVNFLFKGASFSIGENTEGDAYAVAGKGVSFLLASGTEVHTSDLALVYVAGGLLRGTGSFKFYNNDFEEPNKTECGNFDKGSTYSKGYQRKGNSIWGKTGRPAEGGELICEFRIKKSKYPQLKTIFSGYGQETGGGGYHVIAQHFDEGAYAFGQHGWCDDDGKPSEPSRAEYGTYDSGHKVPAGWRYIQLRLTYAFDMNASGTQYSPIYHMGVRMNQDEIDC